jgi:biopolymer transport protein TolR
MQTLNNRKTPYIKNRFLKKNPLNSEINVTPLVDVMLVLLIIFMLTAPMLVSGIMVDLPKTKQTPLSGKDEPLVLSIDAQGNYYLQDLPINSVKLKAKLQAVINTQPKIRIFVRGDKDTHYGNVAQLFAMVKEIGCDNVALITEASENHSKPQTISHAKNNNSKKKINSRNNINYNQGKISDKNTNKKNHSTNTSN